MPSVINADRGIVSGITGIVQTADGTGNLTLQANGVSVLTVDTSNSVTITGLVSATGNITGANILTGGLISATGNVTVGNISATTITETSSIQFKENVRLLANPLFAISQLVGVTYDRRDGTSKDEVGLIAEDVYRIIPELVTLDGQGNPYGIKYTKLTAYLIECIKDLQTQIDQLKKDQ